MDTCTTLPTSQVPADPGRDRGERQRSILVVDDEKDLQRLVARVLDDAGFLVALAGDGSEALAKIRAQPPDLIVLDLMMPEVNGFDVVEALNSRPETASIPVVVVTASTITAEERARLNGFVTTVIGKAGFDSKGFITEVRRAMATAVVGH